MHVYAFVFGIGDSQMQDEGKSHRESGDMKTKS